MLAEGAPGEEFDGGQELREAAEAGFGIEAALMEEIMDRSMEDAKQVAGMFFTH